MIVTIVVLILLIGLLVLVHEVGHFVAAKLSGARVEEFGLGMFFKITSFKKGETEYSLNALPIGGFVKITGEDEEVLDDPKSFSEKTHFQKLFILGAGVFMNFLLTFVILTICFWVGVPNWETFVKIEKVAEGSPAHQAGILAEDKIIKIEDKEVETNTELSDYVKANLGKRVSLEIEREGERKEFEVLLRENPPEDQGAMGIQMSTEIFISSYERVGFFDGIIKGLESTAETTLVFIEGLFYMFKDLLFRGQAPEEVAGPVGIGKIVFELLKFGFRPVLQFAALLSLNLALINLLPFPALDGGRILFVLIEMISRKKIPSRFAMIVNGAGMILLLVLMALITMRDIFRFF